MHTLKTHTCVGTTAYGYTHCVEALPQTYEHIEDCATNIKMLLNAIKWLSPVAQLKRHTKMQRSR